MYFFWSVFSWFTLDDVMLIKNSSAATKWIQGQDWSFSKSLFVGTIPILYLVNADFTLYVLVLKYLKPYYTQQHCKVWVVV